MAVSRYPAAQAERPDPVRLIEIIIQQAPQLIAAGVTSLSVDGLSVTLSAPPPRAPAQAPTPEKIAKSHIDPLRDPSTYPGGKVPGFTRDEEKR